MSVHVGIRVIPKGVAFQRRIRSYTFQNLDHIDLIPFFKEAQCLFITKTFEILQEMPNVKSNSLLEAKFQRPIPPPTSQAETDDAKTSTDETDGQQIVTFYLQSKMKSISATTVLSHWFKTNVVDVIMAKVDQLQEYGSGWTLRDIIQLDVNYNKFKRFSGTSYLPLPKTIKNKHAVINVKNNDNQCFKWAVLSALHPAKDHRIEFQSMKDSKMNSISKTLNFLCP